VNRARILTLNLFSPIGGVGQTNTVPRLGQCGTFLPRQQYARDGHRAMTEVTHSGDTWAVVMPALTSR
jgi:hypothetical protein